MRGVHERKTNLLKLIHSNVYGPMNVNSLGGALYLVILINYASMKVWSYPTKRKVEVFEIFKKIHVVVERETNKLFKFLKTYNKKDYHSNVSKNYCNIFEIKHEKNVLGTSQHNGTAKMMNYIIMEKVRIMFSNSRLENHF